MIRSTSVPCLFAAALTLAACVSNESPPSGAASFVDEAESIGLLAMSSARIKADVVFLADDARAGREAGTPGYDAAAAFVAARMAETGLVPGADGGWLQDISFVTATQIPNESAFIIHAADGSDRALRPVEDFAVFVSAANATTDVKAPVVFAGFGVHAPEFGHDDFVGLDVEGKIVAYFTGAPDTFDSEARAHFGNSNGKRAFIAKRGAVGAITLRTASVEKRFSWERYKANSPRTSTTWAGPDGRARIDDDGVAANVVLGADGAAALFEGAALSFADVRDQADAPGGAPAGFALPVAVTIRGASDMNGFQSANVIGVIPGVDPDRKHQAVVVTAHLDHTGVDSRKRGRKDDRINNGAMDNAIGVAMMLETARRFREGPPPARTIVFIALTAEEKGLLGADYFAHYPTLGDIEIVANVNLDMPLMLHPFTDIVAFGAERSSLGGIVEAALQDANVAVSPDPIPEQGIFTRSDHYRFVEKGVPAIFLWPGFANGGEEVITGFLATHYHKPSDDLSLPIRWGDAARFADINYKIAREIADRVDKPAWNDGDFFGDLFAGD